MAQNEAADLPPSPATTRIPIPQDLEDRPSPTFWAGFVGASTFRSLRHRNYRLYFFGQVVSMTGTWIQVTAMMWLAYQLTHQSKWPALVMAAQLFPTFLLGAWTGSLADRFPKRRLLLVTQSLLLCLALVLTVLVWLGWINPWLLLALATANGVVAALDLPTRLSFVFDMVGREDLMNAVALNSMQFNVARVIGPALAGWILLQHGPELCFLANSLSYLAVLLALVRMDIAGDSAQPSESHGLHSVMAGFGSLAEQPALILLVAMAGVLCICGWPFMTLLPALAQNVLHVHEQSYSLMITATGCGALLAALTVATFGSLDRHRVLISVGTALVVVGLLGLSWGSSLPIAVGCCTLIGLGMILFLATSQSVVQLSVDNAHRGRIMGIWAMTLSGAVPLGNLLAGPAADQWGVPIVLRAQGCACLAAGLVLPLGLAIWTRARQLESRL